jgi:hypothetical protein
MYPKNNTELTSPFPFHEAFLKHLSWLKRAPYYVTDKKVEHMLLTNGSDALHLKLINVSGDFY